MTPVRIFTAAALSICFLLVGLYLGRSSDSSTSPSSGRSYVSTSTSDIKMPGVWLGKSFRGGIPVVSLAVLPGGRLNGLYYMLVYPTRSLVAIEPLVGKKPFGWKTVKTPAGDALLSPDNRLAVVSDPQGNDLKIESYTGSVREVLKYLKVRPGE